MKKFKVIYGLYGIVLLAGTIFTGSYGLTVVNKEIYKNSLVIEEKMSQLGFNKFKIHDYKVRFYNGNYDYVMDNDKVKKEKPIFRSFVATTYEVDGEYEVILPTIENFEKIVSLINVATGIEDENKDIAETSYGNDEHVATLYHEAFHAYQFTNYENIVTNIVDYSKINANETLEQNVVKYIDSNNEAVKLFEDEMAILYNAYYATNTHNTLEYLKEYLEVAKDRKALLSDGEISIEKYYENVEGTACFVESKAYMIQNSKQDFENKYIGKFYYTNGSGKYYTIGMVKCLILEKVKSDWNKDYDFSVEFDKLIEKVSK